MRWRDGQRSALAAVLVLLTIGSGGVDAVCFFGLGQVFTSVMTGNLVLLGLSAGRGEGLSVLRTCVALAGYVLAAFAAARWLPRSLGGAAWHNRLTAALAGELALQAGLATVWFVHSGSPTEVQQFLFVAGYALAMGTQSAITQALAIPGISTTYLTGTLTRTLADLAQRNRSGESVLLRLGIVASVAGGAGCTSVILLLAPAAAPLFPLAATAAAMVTVSLVLHSRPA